MSITYQVDPKLDLQEVIDLYVASTLGKRRPVHRPDIFRKMIDHSDLTITAHDGDRLVGIARTLTDFGFVAYLADLAVHLDYQRRGVGKKLVALTRENLDDTAFLTLLSAPDANEYYPRIGFRHHPRAWVIGEAPLPPDDFW